MRRIRKRILALMLVAVLTVIQVGSAVASDNLTGSGWWTDTQTSTAQTLEDGGSVTFSVAVSSDSIATGEYAAFCVEATDGISYFTGTSDGDCWGDGTDTDGVSTGVVVGGSYTVTIARSGNDFMADIVDDATGSSILANPMVLTGTADFGSTTCYIMSQVGDLTVDVVEVVARDTLTGSGWWVDCQNSTGIELADGYTATFKVFVSSDTLSVGDYAAFCVEATDGTNYFTGTTDGDCWGAGTDTDGTSTGVVVGGSYTVTLSRSGNNFTADIIDNATGSSVMSNAMYLEGTAEFGTTACYIKSQVANLTVVAYEPTETPAVDNSTVEGTTSDRVSVHDPSIVKGYVAEDVTSLTQDTEIVGEMDDAHTKGIYFIFGSHLAWSYSWDLCTWTTFTNNINTNYATLFASDAAWAAKGGTQGNSAYDVSGNMWAPDVIWNEAMGKWCMYMSINGDNWYSGICLLTADSLYGSWTYVGTVIQSGNYGYLTNGATFDYYKATGETEENNNLSRYTANRNGNLTYETNCIDPCVTYDEDGNLWMTYGSWYGGIWMIKLDASTGLRDYSTTYEYEENVTDPYQGYKIAQGFHSSGEASYIEYIDGYYYLFVTYGGLTAAGGYNMRVYRSESITGPYVDESGDAASYSEYQNNVNSTLGMRLMSYYKWSYQTYAQVAQGHNSVYYDEDTDQIYLVYHTRTNDGTEGHSVRVHQLYLNEDGWLVTAPFEYAGETTTNKDITTTSYDTEDIVGTYEVLLQAQAVDFASLSYVEPIYIALNADGTISGDLTGTWETTEGTCYIALTTGTDTYKGVLLTETIEGKTTQTITFTGVGVSTETAIWGYRFEGADALLMEAEAMTLPAQTVNGTDIDLPTEGQYQTTITWSSSNPDILAADGTVTEPETTTVVTLTATISNENGSITADYDVTVLGSDCTDESGNVTVWSDDETYDLTNAGYGTYQFANFFNSTVGTAGLDITNGVSIAFTVQRTGTYDCLSTILGFNAGSQGGLYFDGGSYLGYNATGGWFDANLNNYATGVDYIGEDEVTIEIVILPTSYAVYVDGELAYDMDSVADGTTYGTNSIDTVFSVLTYLSETATELDLGWGSWWDVSFNGTIRNITLTALAGDGSETDASDYIYYEDYDDLAGRTGSDTKFTSANASDYLSVISEDGEDWYLQFANSGAPGNRGAYAVFDESVQTLYNYTVEVDTALTAGVLTQRSVSEFVILGTDASNYTGNDSISYGYILKLHNEPPTGTAANQTDTSLQTTWYINDTEETVEIPVGTWIHITAVVDAEAGTVALMITDRETGEVLYDGTVAVNGSGNLLGLYLLNGRGVGTTLVDNISVACNHQWDEGVVTAATCEEDGQIVYTCAQCGATYTEVIEKTGHSWGAPTWTWSEDGTSAEATFICENDESHMTTVTAEITSTTDGDTVTYVAAVTLEGVPYTDSKTLAVEETTTTGGGTEEEETTTTGSGTEEEETTTAGGGTEEEETTTAGNGTDEEETTATGDTTASDTGADDTTASDTGVESDGSAAPTTADISVAGWILLLVISGSTVTYVAIRGKRKEEKA